MKINDLMGDIINKYAKQTVEKVDTNNNAKKQNVNETHTQGVNDDKVEISNNAKIMLQIGESETDRTQKLNRIKISVNNGTYKPNIEEVAKSILREWKGE